MTHRRPIQQAPTRTPPTPTPPIPTVPPAPPEPRPAGAVPAPEDGRPAGRRRQGPHLSGDLPAMLDNGPVFARGLHGYDRLQVDNYVAWAESELRAAERINADLMRRLTASEVESLRARQLLAQSPGDRHLARIADRVTELLGLAAQEAAAHAQATAADAEQSREVVTSAYQEAEVVVRRARRLEAQAAARLQEAERRLAEARRAEEETRSAVQDMLAAAAEEQERLEGAAEARLAHARWELAELRRRAHQIRRGLTGQLDAALAVLADEPVPGFSFTANLAGPPVAVPHPARDPVEQDRALEA